MKNDDNDSDCMSFVRKILSKPNEKKKHVAQQYRMRLEEKKGKQTEKQLNQSSHSQYTDYKLFARMENSCLSLANFK